MSKTNKKEEGKKKILGNKKVQENLTVCGEIIILSGANHRNYQKLVKQN